MTMELMVKTTLFHYLPNLILTIELWSMYYSLPSTEFKNNPHRKSRM